MILNEENVRALAAMDKQIILNTYNLISTAIPEMKRENDSLFICCGSTSEEITYFDECVFITLCEFTYIPLWYIFNELKEMDPYCDPLNKIKNWKKLNLIFIDQQTIGEFLRPTNYLFQILQLKRKKYETIPFNMLSHTMSKLDVYLKSMTGISYEMSNFIDENFTNRKINLNNIKIEPTDILDVRKELNNDILNLLEGEKASKFVVANNNHYLKVIDEKDIKIAKSNTEKIASIENKIREQLLKKEFNTVELKDSSMFFCAVADGDKYILQFPDLIIPMKRNANGSPNSVAIEMELTAKSLQNYERNLKKYRNSLKFGSVIWFCGDNRVKKNLTEAFKNIGGTGFTQTYLYDYSPPKRRDITV